MLPRFTWIALSLFAVAICVGSSPLLRADPPAPPVSDDAEGAADEMTILQAVKPAVVAPEDTAAPNLNRLIVPASETEDIEGDETLALVHRAINLNTKRQLTAGYHTPWQIVHGILAYRWDFQLRKSAESPETISAIEYIMSGVYHKGLPLWHETPHGGRGHEFTQPWDFEGHPTQFMGYMTMANLPLSYEIKTPTKVITVKDVLADAKANVKQKPGHEITWTLWFLTHYEEPDSSWTSAHGEPWSIERLVKIQVDEPVYRAACGGTHGLFALAYARNLWLSTGQPLTGVWMEADYKVKYHIELQKNLQNPDGSFSSNYYVGPGYSNDFQVRLKTSGHQAEWLMVALPERRLKEEWVQRALRSIANDLINNSKANVEDVGALYHAIHALVLYRQRTIPGYLVPQRNSHIKLTDRDKPYVNGSRPTRRNSSTNKKVEVKTSNGSSKAVVDPTSAPAPSKRVDASKVEPIPNETSVFTESKTSAKSKSVSSNS